MAKSYKYYKEKRKNKILTGLLALLLVAGIGVGVYAATNYDSLEDKAPTQQVEDETPSDDILEETPSDEVLEDEVA